MRRIVAATPIATLAYGSLIRIEYRGAQSPDGSKTLPRISCCAYANPQPESWDAQLLTTEADRDLPVKGRAISWSLRRFGVCGDCKI